ncbi:hypothetical protein DSO57_1004620 [Entomophthora muscae]|nr:hypothetical protein DSO57_1004620 [Entomophthora muscae]
MAAKPQKCCCCISARMGCIFIAISLILASIALGVSMPLISTGYAKLLELAAIPLRVALVATSCAFLVGISKVHINATTNPAEKPQESFPNALLPGWIILLETLHEAMRLGLIFFSVKQGCSRNHHLPECSSFIINILISIPTFMLAIIFFSHSFTVARSYSKELKLDANHHHFEAIPTGRD